MKNNKQHIFVESNVIRLSKRFMFFGICKIWSKYPMRFKSYEHFTKWPQQARRMLSEHKTIKKVILHVNRYGMLTYICMLNVMKIYHVVQELWAFSLTDHGRADIQSDIVQTQGSCNYSLQWTCTLTFAWHIIVLIFLFPALNLLMSARSLFIGQ